MYMDDYVKQLDMVLSSGNRKLLEGAGTVSHRRALEKAKAEYRKYQEITLSPVESGLFGKCQRSCEGTEEEKMM